MNFLSMTFGKADIVILIIVLLFGIAGLVRGFLKQILSVANGLVSIIISCLILTPATNLAMNTPLGDMVNDKVLEVVVEKYPQTAEVPLSLIEETEDMSIVFEEAGLSKIASKIACEFINLDKVSSDAYLSDAIAEGIGHLVLSGILFVVLFIVILILIKVLIRVLDSLVDNGILKFVNKTLGLLLGIAKGAILVCIVVLVMSILARYVTSINDFVIKEFALNSENFSIAKYLYENNPLVLIWNIVSSKAA